MKETAMKKPEAGQAREKIVGEDTPEPFCTKPFAAESAREEDEDGPCKDGSG